MAESLNYRKHGCCVPRVTHRIFCLIHFVPEYQEESLFKLLFYPRSPRLCVCFCVMHCRSWSLHWCTKQTPLPSSLNFWGVLVPFPREQGYWCIYPLTFILFHLWSQSAVTCLELCRQKAVYQNISTMFCRTSHYHSQFGMCHIKTLGWSVSLGWDQMRDRNDTVSNIQSVDAPAECPVKWVDEQRSCFIAVDWMQKLDFLPKPLGWCHLHRGNTPHRILSS